MVLHHFSTLLIQYGTGFVPMLYNEEFSFRFFQCKRIRLWFKKKKKNNPVYILHTQKTASILNSLKLRWKLFWLIWQRWERFLVFLEIFVFISFTLFLKCRHKTYTHILRFNQYLDISYLSFLWFSICQVLAATEPLALSGKHASGALDQPVKSKL